VQTGGIALFIEEECIYRVRDAGGAHGEAVRALRERACAACRDCANAPEVGRWNCCAVFFNGGELASHFCDLDAEEEEG
jgi:hypothetical protein